MSDDTPRVRSVKWWWISAIVVFAVGMTLALIGVQRDQQIISDLVRTPSGCVSTIDISATGRYYIYVETKGTIADLGACNNDARAYTFETAPEVTVSLQSSDGTDVDVRPDDSVEYDAPDFVGKSMSTFVLSEPGTFTLVMQSNEPDAVIAIGRNASMMDGAMLISGASLVLVALALLILAIIATRASRRARRKVAMSARPEVYVSYQSSSDSIVGSDTRSSDPWAPPRPEDRAGQ
ncbi:MAG: hypothetical protein WCK23_03070 [Actinomycetes bacterium]